MYSRQTTVMNKSGLHARPAADFVKTAVGFLAAIKISRPEQPDYAVNAKSMVRLLSLSISKGTQIQISAEGIDEKIAVDTLIALVDTGFDDK